MCLNPIKIKNPKVLISKEGGTKYIIEVPCGQCSECIDNKRREITARCYYECMDTISSGGYVYFDTLTYDNKHLPLLSDIVPSIKRGSRMDTSCYRTDDIRLFLVRLRRKAEYYDKKLKNNFKYFVASEYGSRDEYIDERGRKKVGTERPHYHIICFVKGNGINHFELSNLIDECWGKGRTDGVRYKGKKYVNGHTFQSMDNAELMKNVCKYVSKYVVKDVAYNTKVERRLDALNIDEDEKRRIIKNMLNFTRWSKGFGLYGLEYNRECDLKNGDMRIPHKKKVWDYMPLSGYLDRKLYYICEDGHWSLTDEGKVVKKQRINKAIERVEKKFVDFMCSIGTMKFYDETNKNSLYRKAIKDTIKEYLGERSTWEFAAYLTLMKGRVKSEAAKIANEDGYIYVDEIEKIIECDLMSHKEVEESGYYITNFSHYKYRKLLGSQFVCEDKDIRDIIAEYEEKGVKEDFVQWWNSERDRIKHESELDFDDKRNAYLMLATEMEKRWCINERSHWAFANYDKLERLWYEAMKANAKYKQEAWEAQERLRKKIRR